MVMAMAKKPTKPSDYMGFCYAVFLSSGTVMEFEQYFAVYSDVLRLLFWNPDIDTPLAIKKAEEQANAKN